MSFVSAQALNGHIQGKHKIRSALRRKAVGSVCPCCLMDFHARARLREHLRTGRAYCVEQAATWPDLDDATIEEEDKKEAEVAREWRAQGLGPMAGRPSTRAPGPLTVAATDMGMT